MITQVIINCYQLRLSYAFVLNHSGHTYSTTRDPPGSRRPQHPSLMGTSSKKRNNMLCQHTSLHSLHISISFPSLPQHYKECQMAANFRKHRSGLCRVHSASNCKVIFITAPNICFNEQDKKQNKC